MFFVLVGKMFFFLSFESQKNKKNRENVFFKQTKYKRKKRGGNGEKKENGS